MSLAFHAVLSIHSLQSTSLHLQRNGMEQREHQWTTVSRAAVLLAIGNFIDVLNYQWCQVRWGVWM